MKKNKGLRVQMLTCMGAILLQQRSIRSGRPQQTPWIFHLSFLWLVAMLQLSACQSKAVQTPTTLLGGDTVHALGNQIDALYQDSKGQMWFGSNGEGLYRFDGKALVQFTEKHGLCSPFVWSIQEDNQGILWLNTRDGVCRFDGAQFSDLSFTLARAPLLPLHYRSGGIFLHHPKGIGYFDGKEFSYFNILPKNYQAESNNANRPYSVYSSLVDKNGQIWFGTQEKGVCRYDGKSLTYYTGSGLEKAAVRALFQDSQGRIWAGNNGGGLYYFKEDKFVNYSAEKNLENPDFLKSLTEKTGTLSRVFTIEEDAEGNLWAGSMDSGLWKIVAGSPVNVDTKKGLPGNGIWKLYRDKNNRLWAVIGGVKVGTFDGKQFHAFIFP